MSENAIVIIRGKKWKKLVADISIFWLSNIRLFTIKW